LAQLTQLAVAEATDKRTGGESILARLSELMFVEAVRRHLDAMPSEQTGWLAGWLAGLRDRPVAWTQGRGSRLAVVAGFFADGLNQRTVCLNQRRVCFQRVPI